MRERLDLLLDPGTWVEYGMLADHMDAGLGDRYLAADGAVTGIGEIDGRPVAVAAYDFTVMAGSMGGVGENKIAGCARTRCASASRSCGCSTPPARASSRRAGRRSRAPARCSASRSR